MKRWGRWVLDVTAVLSLLICLATATLWVRSYFASDRVIFYQYEDDGPWLYWHTPQIYVGRGAIGFERLVQGFEPGTREQFLQRFGGRGTTRRVQVPAYPDFHASAKQPEPILGVRLGHFAIWNEGQGHRPRDTEFFIIVPLAYPFVVSLAVAVIGLWAWRKRLVRRRAGLCTMCQYDLTGNVSGACPECGTPAPAPEVSHA